MNRFKKICGSLVLAASLVAGLTATGAPTAQAAASEAELNALKTQIETVAAATKKVAAENTTQSDSVANISISALGMTIASIPVTLKTTVDPKTQKASIIGNTTLPDLSTIGSIMPDLNSIIKKLNLKAGERKIQAYGDFAKKTIYLFNSELGRSEVADLPATLVGGSILDSLDTSAFAGLAPYLTITTGKSDVTLNLKADEAGVKASTKDINKLLKGFASGVKDNETVKSLMKTLMAKASIKGIDITAKFGLDTTGVLKEHSVDAKIDLTYDGNPVGISFSNATQSSVSTETVEIPEAFTKGAQLIANYPVSQGGINFVSKLSGKKTVFSVSSVKNAKKLTIPATITKLGTKYSVSDAAKNAFKKATKLKTLTIKNAALKKAVKKNPSKYGVKKGVKIK